jgi:hypothetical protein
MQTENLMVETNRRIAVYIFTPQTTRGCLPRIKCIHSIFVVKFISPLFLFLSRLGYVGDALICRPT